MSDAADRILAVLATEVQSAIILDTGDVRAVCLRVKELEADIAIYVDVAFSKRDRCRELEAENERCSTELRSWMQDGAKWERKVAKLEYELARLRKEAKG